MATTAEVTFTDVNGLTRACSKGVCGSSCPVVYCVGIMEIMAGAAIWLIWVSKCCDYSILPGCQNFQEALACVASSASGTVFTSSVTSGCVNRNCILSASNN